VVRGGGGGGGVVMVGGGGGGGGRLSLNIIIIYLYSFTNNELEIFNTALGKASCGIEISRLLLVNSCR